MAAKEKTVEQVLAKLDMLLEPVRENQKIVEKFLSNLKTTTDNSLLDGSTFFHGGSVFEGLAVHKDTDFDISLQLGRCFVCDKFQIKRRHEKYFYLVLRENTPLHPRLKKYVSDDGHLKSKELHEDVTSELEAILNRLVFPPRKICCKKLLRALHVELSCEGEQNIEMDIVPCIPVSSLVWKDCPELVELEKLPLCLQKEIEKMEKNGNRFVFNTLTVSNSEKYHRGEELGELSFGQLEKSFFRSNVKIRDMVRLVKLVAHRRGWSDLGLRPFLIKWLAIKISDELDSRTKWDGYKFLLEKIKERITNEGSMEHFFIKQAHYRIKKSNLLPLQQRLNDALKLTATDLYNMV